MRGVRIGYDGGVLSGLGVLRALLGGGIILAAPPASSETQYPAVEPDHVRISFVAPRTCPDKASLVAQISKRVTIPWLADDTELARHIAVALEQTPTGFRGRMDYVDGSGRTVTRSLDAPDCDQAMAGIALVTALAIETQAATPLPEADSPRAPADAPTQRQIAATGTAAAVEASATHASSTEAVRADSSATSSSSAPSPTAARESMRHEVGAFAGAMRGVGPGVAFGGAVFWGIGQEPFPVVRVIARWYQAGDGEDSASGMDARFRVIAGAPQLCMGHSFVGALAGALCAGIELGQYMAQGTTGDASLFDTHAYYLFWAAAEVAAPVRLAGKTAFVQLEPALRFPLVDGSFTFNNPDELVYDIPDVALALNLAVGITFR
ncbi:MAG TPA: hypothetical protein VF103_15655 [Polyangiaceae bacterium]